MLTSISPFGERARGRRWGITVAFFVIGALGGGVLIFGASGALGALIGIDTASPFVPLIAVVAAFLLDLAGVRPPGPKRQVDEDWLNRYRGWIVGLGFGFQLGVGLSTIVPTFTVYALLVLAAGSGPTVGALLGASFAVGRSLHLLGMHDVQALEDLVERIRRFHDREALARMALAASSALVAVALISETL